MNDRSESESPGYSVTVPLAPNAIEVLEQLFIQGPTWDGDVVSKSGRDDLFDLKLAGRHEGYQFLTLAGVRLALANKMDRKKNARRRMHSDEIDKYRRIAEIVMPRDGCGVATNQQQALKTVGQLEEILKRPEPTA